MPVYLSSKWTIVIFKAFINKFANLDMNGLSIMDIFNIISIILPWQSVDGSEFS